MNSAKALRLDPGNTLALYLLARRLGASRIHGVDMTAEAARLEDLVRKALAVDPNDGNARFAKGLLAMVVYVRDDEAAVEFERAIAENPSNIEAYAYLGTSALTRDGQRRPSPFSTKRSD